MPLFQLDANSITFPPAELALEDPNGLLAIGGDLRTERIIAAYRNGIFPWYSDDQPILWWSPNPRAVLYPDNIHISRSLRKFMSTCPYAVSCDSAFAQVIDACAAPRQQQPGTWITSDMREAYIRLHELGFAHSVEVWDSDNLIGGLYGIALGAAFFGESMFSTQPNASKVALVMLAQLLGKNGYHLIDCQVHTSHLASMGAIDVPRTRFLSELNAATIKNVAFPGSSFSRRVAPSHLLVSP